MAAISRRPLILTGAVLINAVLLWTALGSAPQGRADAVAYLVNVTVRPGYNFANADHALQYGYGICDRVGEGQRYGQMISDIKLDFSTTDDYQAAYLINQAVNELCPNLIWQLRNSAVGYVPGASG